MTAGHGYKLAASRSTSPGGTAEPFGYGAPSASVCTHSGWTDERVKLLKNLWQDGLSAGQIAKQLGGVSRNAVIGKVHRMGLSGRAAAARPTRLAKLPKVPKPWQPRAPDRPLPPEPIPRTPRAACDLVDLIQLGACMCRFPIGDPKAEGFGFCGCEAEDGHPYCGEHEAVVYDRTPTKKRPSANELMRNLRRYA